jgi:hypothetical protein
MKTRIHRFRSEAGELLVQLTPHNVLRDVGELLLKFENDAILHNYLRSRIRIATPVVFVFIFVSTVCAIAVMFFVPRLIEPPVPFLYRLLVLLVGAAVWFGGIFAQTGIFAVWLEQRAIERNRAGAGHKPAPPAGVLNYLKYSRTMFPWLLVTLFVVLPLGILVYFAPVVALAIIAVLVAAPYLYDKVDT